MNDSDYARQPLWLMDFIARGRMATPRKTCRAWLLAWAGLAAALVAGPQSLPGQGFERLPPLSEVIEAGWLEEEGSSDLPYSLDLGPGAGSPLALPRAGLFQQPAAEGDWQGGPALEGSLLEGSAALPLDGSPEASLRRGLWNDICLDHVHFYSWTTLRQTLPVLGGAAALANTPVDVEIRNWWQGNLANQGLDDFWDGAKQMGEGKWMIPLCAGAWVAGEFMSTEDSAHWLGQWGGRTTRGYLVGFPVLLMSQYLVGASRPYEGDGSSHWAPFEDNNGVSGHAFMGSMPFLTAANMVESPWAKAFCYAGSAITPLSRIEHDAHFTSQAILGWWLAFMASNAIDNTITSYGGWSIEPMPVRDGVGMMFAWQH
jgi:hypothetical protein